MPKHSNVLPLEQAGQGRQSSSSRGRFCTPYVRLVKVGQQTVVTAGRRNPHAA
ncbi:hypothetical protein BCM14_2691 [Jezberella montanilacus]|uniref:Uncharacterized protein n=1 Tax=Jezberella montanilacus TaxID=323426 RepID=A0A2T0XBX5_9BURK|nr:hypothetical protein [Jezberella montanilacus]PRY96453.1 hypothetical protein BCM14_2691 [Jezberella montanilacus]